MGLVDHLAPDGDVVAAARAYVEDLAREVSPASLRDIKRLVYRHAGTHYTDALREADDWQWRSLDRIDATEGAEALAQKRGPQFPRLGVGGATTPWPPVLEEP
jgi:enoyl-CoA hydratase/carnithine racemase